MVKRNLKLTSQVRRCGVDITTKVSVLKLADIAKETHLRGYGVIVHFAIDCLWEQVPHAHKSFEEAQLALESMGFKSKQFSEAIGMSPQALLLIESELEKEE